MRFFNIDLHIAPSTAIKHVLEAQGHQVDQWLLSAHTWVHGKTQARPEVINADNWRELSPEMVERFYRRYRHELADYDAFYVTFPPGLAVLFEPWGKPIIVYASIRYEGPFTADKTRWAWFNDFLRQGVASGQIFTVGGNSFDTGYAEYHTGFDWPTIYPLDDYYDAPYTGERAQWLLWSRSPWTVTAPCVVDQRVEFQGRYTWQQVSSYAGCIYVPYSTHAGKVAEMYWACQPMMFPTHRFLMELYQQCGPQEILKEMTWEQVYSLPPGSGPNNYADPAEVARWTKLCDFYDTSWYPNLVYYDSWREMAYRARSAATKEISARMAEDNRWRKARVYAAWEGIIRRIADRSPVA
jgi:hypothetical protein